MNPNIRHNYNNLMVGYYRDRIDALIRKIEQLENMLEFKQIQIEKLMILKLVILSHEKLKDHLHLLLLYIREHKWTHQ